MFVKSFFERFFELSLNSRLSRRTSSQVQEVLGNEQDFAPKLIEEEEAATGSVGWGVYVRYFKSIGLWMTFIGFVSNLFFQGASVYSNSRVDTFCCGLFVKDVIYEQSFFEVSKEDYDFQFG